MWAPGTVVANRYRVERLLKQGGMGAVFAARHVVTGRAVALKAMHPSLVGSARMTAKFFEEARTSARIPSAHVVVVEDVDVDPASGTPWAAMELLDGEDLDGRCQREGPLPHGELRWVFEELAAGVGAAHDVGVVHLDLKPSNLFAARLQLHGRTRMLKLLDFGISRVLAAHRSNTLMTQGAGTPGWMCPEQCSKGGRVSVRSDVWAMGLIAFYLATGRAFWRAIHQTPGNTPALLVEMVGLPLPAASERAAELGVAHLLPAGFDGWLSRCLQREPASRFAHGREAGEALVRLLHPAALDATQPLSPPTPGPARPTLAVDGPTAPDGLPTVPDLAADLLARVAALR